MIFLPSALKYSLVAVLGQGSGLVGVKTLGMQSLCSRQGPHCPSHEE